ncbi:hypothetical protein Tsubulata_030344 [Turnera subulata]|uniref:Cytochrome P450 n=1 Tax=Turnera subulata TaxID=218843 RepID=A0A9Q0G8C5_9ROSI|nr:hypothetical protein Tsubulata_030344 [Turnera subulata]
MKGDKKNRKTSPEPAGSWPVIGHLHVLAGGNMLVHRTLGGIADKYGPIFSLRLGIHRALVVSDWEAVEECFSTNDRLFLSRPTSLAVKIMGYNHVIFGFAPYGKYWREIRKLAMVELLSNRRLELMKHVRDSEVTSLGKELYKKAVKNGGSVVVEMKESIGDLAMNIIVRMIAGKRYFGDSVEGNKEESRRCQKAFSDFFYLVGLFLVSDAVPFLGWLDSVMGTVGKMKRTAMEIDSVLGSWVNEHRQKRLKGSIEEEEQDFIHVMLSIMDGDQISSVGDTDTTIKATCLKISLLRTQTKMKFLLHLQEIYLSAFLFLIGTTIFLILATKYASRNKKHRKTLPEPAGSWPVIGHLHVLAGGNRLVHRTLGDMADKYGPILSLRLGIHRALVVSDWEAVKECFSTNDRLFLSRPTCLAVKIMGYNHVIFGFAPYGKYWREIRKLAMVELLSHRRLELMKHVRDTEVSLFVKQLHRKAEKNGGSFVVEMKEPIGDLTMNIIVRMIAGKRYNSGDSIEGNNEESRRCQKAFSDFFHLMGLFLVSDAVPFLGWLDSVKGTVGKMKRTAREIDGVLGSWVNEHRQKRLKGSITQEEQDFIHVMLSMMDGGQISSVGDTDTTIKATCLNLLLGASDTTVITLTWALSLLLNNPKVLKKAQDELDDCVGKNQLVDEADIKNLVYLQAIVKETLRLYPPAPLGAPREAMEDCEIAGFHVPAGTRLFVNMWKLHRDPRIWSNPLEFQPERFLTEHINVDVGGMDFEYTPFGSGRRMCPGVTFGLQVVHLTLARLLQGFELRTASDAPVDMTESPGSTTPKATPLDVLLRPRLCSTIYEELYRYARKI